MNNTIQTLERFRHTILGFYQEKRTIHVSINITHPKTNLIQVPARIKHVSSQLFVIEPIDPLYLPISAFQYADLLTRRIIIQEMEG